MSLISFTHNGRFDKTSKLLTNIKSGKYLKGIDRYAQEGVDRLKEYTPKDTGVTANSWSYKISKTKYGIEIAWMNSNLNNGISIAMLIQYGHGTGSGVYIEGVDYINPALKPVFEKIGNKVWREVTHSAE